MRKFFIPQLKQLEKIPSPLYPDPVQCSGPRLFFSVQECSVKAHNNKDFYWSYLLKMDSQWLGKEFHSADLVYISKEYRINKIVRAFKYLEKVVFSLPYWQTFEQAPPTHPCSMTFKDLLVENLHILPFFVTFWWHNIIEICILTFDKFCSNNLDLLLDWVNLIM